MKKDERVYLQHILDAIERISAYIAGFDQDAFQQNPLVQDGVIRQIEIIGEATKRLSIEVRSEHADIPWSDIARMRDKLIHNYFGVDIAKVWVTAVDDLPPLERRVRDILAAWPDAE